MVKCNPRHTPGVPPLKVGRLMLLVAPSRIEGGDRDRNAPRCCHAIDHPTHLKKNVAVPSPRATERPFLDVADRDHRASGCRHPPQLAARKEGDRTAVRRPEWDPSVVGAGHRHERGVVEPAQEELQSAWVQNRPPRPLIRRAKCSYSPARTSPCDLDLECTAFDSQALQR